MAKKMIKTMIRGVWAVGKLGAKLSVLAGIWDILSSSEEEKRYRENEADRNVAAGSLNNKISNNAVANHSVVNKKKGIYESFLKRPIDFFLSFMAFIFLFPVMAVLYFLVKKKLGSPVFFKQERPGRYEKVFSMVKFRTMTDARDEEGNLLPDEERLPKFGKLLRSTSLDELPELWNILKGDMSIVGPRPLLTKYLPRYNAHQRRRHEVRPGFTGLAQVHGRNALTWEEKFDWDVKYVDEISFAGDAKIVLDTVKVVLKKEGISSEGSATMEEFMGTDAE